MGQPNYAQGAPMEKSLERFLTSETGAVTVDWVVLTAAIIGLGGAVMVSTGSGTMSLASLAQTTLTDQEINGYGVYSGPTVTGVRNSWSVWLEDGDEDLAFFDMSNGEVWVMRTLYIGDNDPVVSLQVYNGPILDTDPGLIDPDGFFAVAAENYVR
jgi:hypothetical protein